MTIRTPYTTPDDLAQVTGLLVGHCTLTARATGCTVVLCPEGAVGGVDVRGGAPGTRETDLLAPDATVTHVHAVMLSGGSAFGLQAAHGAMQWLEARGHGFKIARACVPIVPAAVLFDLWHGDIRIRPDAASGHAACDAALASQGARVWQGPVGAGAGATVGKLFGFERASPGGVGSASITSHGVTVGALMAVNAVGDIVDPSRGCIVAGAHDEQGHWLDCQAKLLREGRSNLLAPAAQQAGGATVIGVVATNARLSKAQAKRLATMAHDGLARTIKPAHTVGDGDTIFALATGRQDSQADVDMMVLGAMAAQVVEVSVLRAVKASGLGL
jgi:L-aminopeptidase/D-esterase-like protein